LKVYIWSTNLDTTYHGLFDWPGLSGIGEAGFFCSTFLSENLLSRNFKLKVHYVVILEKKKHLNAFQIEQKEFCFVYLGNSEN
jgi:hypothetical protein